MTDLAVYTGVFASAFLAATIFPAQSEAGLAYLVAMGENPVWLLVLLASAGNTGGAVVNWYLGRQLGRFSDRRWFSNNKARLATATSWYQKYGYWSLLASWMPIIGDFSQQSSEASFVCDAPVTERTSRPFARHYIMNTPLLAQHA